MKGILFGVGVGPGDPELMTYKAIRTIEACPVIAVPANGKEHAVSYRIAAQIVKNIETKECLNLKTPMTKDKKILGDSYEKAVTQIAEELEKGKDVAYLTLGDPTIYSTYMYIHRMIREKGYETRIINGVPSFCAVSAKFDDSLVDRSEQLHIIPSSYEIEEALNYPGTKVLMKPASRFPDIRKKLTKDEAYNEVRMIENCGMPGEKIYDGIAELPEQAGYYSLLILKESEKDEKRQTGK